MVFEFAGDAAADLAARYVWDPAAVDQILAAEEVTSLSTAGDVLWPLADHLGTPRDLAVYNDSTDTTTVANHRVYDAFGTLLSESSSAVSLSFVYTGVYSDAATVMQRPAYHDYDVERQ